MRLLASTLLALPLLGGALSALDVTAVAPTAGAQGTVVTLTGEGFGPKPRVFLRAEGLAKTPRLKVLSVSDTRIEARLRAAPAGSYQLVVRPAGKGQAELAAPQAFEVALPEVLSVTPASASPGDTVTITGRHFGTKRARVRLGGAKAKVLSWQPGSLDGAGGATDQAVVRLRKKRVFAGPQAFEIRSKAGTGGAGALLSVTNSNHFKYGAFVAGDGYQSLNKFGFPGHTPTGDGGTRLIGVSDALDSNKLQTLEVVLLDFDPSAYDGPLPVTLKKPHVAFRYTVGVGDDAAVFSDLPDLTDASQADPDAWVRILSIGDDGLLAGSAQTLKLPGASSGVLGQAVDVTGFSFAIRPLAEDVVTP